MECVTQEFSGTVTIKLYRDKFCATHTFSGRISISSLSLTSNKAFKVLILKFEKSISVQNQGHMDFFCLSEKSNRTFNCGVKVYILQFGVVFHHRFCSPQRSLFLVKFFVLQFEAGISEKRRPYRLLLSQSRIKGFNRSSVCSLRCVLVQNEDPIEKERVSTLFSPLQFLRLVGTPPTLDLSSSVRLSPIIALGSAYSKYSRWESAVNISPEFSHAIYSRHVNFAITRQPDYVHFFNGFFPRCGPCIPPSCLIDQ